MNLSSSNFTNSAKYLIKTKIKSIFYKLPTNKYATGYDEKKYLTLTKTKHPFGGLQSLGEAGKCSQVSRVSQVCCKTLANASGGEQNEPYYGCGL